MARRSRAGGGATAAAHARRSTAIELYRRRGPRKRAGLCGGSCFRRANATAFQTSFERRAAHARKHGKGPSGRSRLGRREAEGPEVADDVVAGTANEAKIQSPSAGRWGGDVGGDGQPGVAR